MNSAFWLVKHFIKCEGGRPILLSFKRAPDRGVAIKVEEVRWFRAKQWLKKMKELF
jgi:hypothetical protein